MKKFYRNKILSYIKLKENFLLKKMILKKNYL